MVITLSGSVLFVSNKSELLAGARLKLDEVANALTRQDSESKISGGRGTPIHKAAPFTMKSSRRDVPRRFAITS